ncbi:hypothetical protein [Vulcanisaeta thermophila]|uniref:hypothetical protein n=1 Tax=Vulcanisaeta thermophila TaxID=867917 RepID=UPI000853DCAC|nr:hypothetical protein [Vulcanisaeta thermophila]
MNAKRYLALALLSSALWGVTYPLTYIALRLTNAVWLITLTYLITVLILTPYVFLRGLHTRSLMWGLLLSLINYPMVYLYTVFSGDMGGFASFLSSLYIVPLIIIEYFRTRRLNLRYLSSSALMLLGLYALYGVENQGMILLALPLLILNLAYLIYLEFLGDYDEASLMLGQSVGTLALSMAWVKYMDYPMVITPWVISYSIALSLLNTMANILYVMAIRRVGTVSTSLASSMEITTSMVVSIPIEPLPPNYIAWILLILSLMVLLLPAINPFSDGCDLGMELQEDVDINWQHIDEPGMISLPSVDVFHGGGSVI